jgi:hypothetical protein
VLYRKTFACDRFGRVLPVLPQITIQYNKQVIHDIIGKLHQHVVCLHSAGCQPPELHRYLREKRKPYRGQANTATVEVEKTDEGKNDGGWSEDGVSY